jgi:hypothetical protein
LAQLYTSDTSDRTKNKITFCADDSELAGVANTAEATASLQKDLENPANWLEK